MANKTSLYDKNFPFVTGRKPLPRQSFGGESEVPF